MARIFLNRAANRAHTVLVRLATLSAAVTIAVFGLIVMSR
jgi:hypothetical protein